MNGIDRRFVELNDRFARLGHKLVTPYVDVLGYADIDGVVATYRPMLADLRTRPQNHRATLAVRNSGGSAFSAHTCDHEAEWYFLDPENRPANYPGVTVDFRALEKS